jgi:hypothetical protein
MSSKMPPVPPAERSNKGPGSEPATAAKSTGPKEQTPANLAEQNRQGNIRQNTHHQGYQQDR